MFDSLSHEQSHRELPLQLTAAEIDFVNRLLPRGFSVQTAGSGLPRRKEVVRRQGSARPDPEDHFSSEVRPPRLKKQPEPRLPRLHSEDLKRCYEIFKLLKAHDKAYPFMKPVDPEELGIPEYRTIVKDPMDLGTIEQKFYKDDYSAV